MDQILKGGIFCEKKTHDYRFGFMSLISIALPASAAETTSAQNSIKQIQMTHVNVPFTNESVDQVGQASTKDAVVINGITNYLYPTFDDLDSALVKLKSKIPDYYRLVEKQVDLTEAYDRLYTEY